MRIKWYINYEDGDAGRWNYLVIPDDELSGIPADELDGVIFDYVEEEVQRTITFHWERCDVSE